MGPRLGGGSWDTGLVQGTWSGPRAGWLQVSQARWEGKRWVWVVGWLRQELPGSHSAVLGAQDFLGQAFVALGEVIGSQRGRLERALT